MPLSVQLHALVLTTLTGVALGLLWDAQALLRRFLRPEGRMRDVFDGALALVAALVVASGLFFAGWGELRLYALFGGGLGLWAYFSLGSQTVVWAGERVLHRAARAVARVGEGLRARLACGRGRRQN